MVERTLLFDVHCHLHAKELFQELDSVLMKAKAKNVQVIAVSMDVNSSKCSIEIARQYDEVYAAVGLHPWRVETPSQVEPISALLHESREEITAIGEVGLDHTFVKDPQKWEAQERALEQLIDLAKKFNLPLITHGKGFEAGLVKFLIDNGAEDVVLHWFVGDVNTVKRALEVGFYFSITPAVLFQMKLREVVKLVPLDRLMLESDGPTRYKTLQGSPSAVPFIATEIARIKQVPEDKIANITTQTVNRVFRIGQDTIR